MSMMSAWATVPSVALHARVRHLPGRAVKAPSRALPQKPHPARCVGVTRASSSSDGEVSLPKGARAKRGRGRRDGRPKPCRSSREDSPSQNAAVTSQQTATSSNESESASASDAVISVRNTSAGAEASMVQDAPSSDWSSREIGTVACFAALAAGTVANAGGPTTFANELERAFESLIANHLPGVGGVIEDSFLGLLTVCTVYSLWRSSLVPKPIGNPITRKSKTLASWAHVISGGGALLTGLYGIGLERIYRETPGWGWMWVSSALFLTNALTYTPLMAIFKASKEGKYAMKLGYSFVASFQGVVFIAWSARSDAPDWMYYAVMPFWFFSIGKLWESTEFVLALAPDSETKKTAPSLLDKISAGSKKRLGKMTPDAATLTYVSLNAFAAVFDNCYMALYTVLGPEQFWHTSQTFNDADFHLRMVKGTTGSLTVALLIFISTLGWRKQMPMSLAIWLNVILGSVGPWIVLFWHKLQDPSENWFPQFVFDPAYDYHPLWDSAAALGAGN